MTHLNRLRDQLAAAEQALVDFDQAHAPKPVDPGTHSMNAHRTDAQIGANVQAAVNHYGRIHKQEQRLEETARAARVAVLMEERRIQDEESAPTLALLPNARLVRDRYGWHRVKTVNRKTVTVWGHNIAGGLETRTIPIDRIKEVKS